MKILTIGNINLEIAEKIEELSASREKDIRTLILSLFQYEQTTIEVITNAISDLNKQSFVSASQKLANYLDFLNVNKDINIYNAIFCLITFEKNEKKATLSNLEILDKSKKLEEQGLTFETVKKEIESFFLQYPKIKRQMDIISKI